MCEHLVEPRGHDEEGCRGLMSSRCSGGRQVVALQNILVLRLALVELVVLSSDSGHLEHVTQHLSSCTQEAENHMLVSDGKKNFLKHWLTINQGENNEPVASMHALTDIIITCIHV